MKISYLRAIKDVENGIIDMNSLGSIVSSFGKTEESYVKSKNEFYSQYYKLQILMGNYNKQTK